MYKLDSALYTLLKKIANGATTFETELHPSELMRPCHDEIPRDLSMLERNGFVQICHPAPRSNATQTFQVQITHVGLAYVENKEAEEFYRSTLLSASQLQATAAEKQAAAAEEQTKAAKIQATAATAQAKWAKYSFRASIIAILISLAAILITLICN
jgi:hypothetical protein